MGFAGIETTVLGEEMVAAAYEAAHERETRGLELRSTCPVAVDWVRKFYPDLVPRLAAVAPPYVAQARLIREMYPEDVAIVYVSPCWARKDEIYRSELDEPIDVAIGFDELRIAAPRCASQAADAPVPRHPTASKELSGTDGFPRRTLRGRDLTDGGMSVVRGLGEIDRLLGAIRRGETSPCRRRHALLRGLHRRAVCPSRDVRLRQAHDRCGRARAPATTRRRQPHVPLGAARRSSSTARSRRSRLLSTQPTAEEIDNVLAAGEFTSPAEHLDCGLCGYDTCVAHADAVWLGNSTWEMCFPLERKRLLREHERLVRGRR